MMRSVFLASVAVILCACTHHRRTVEPPLDAFVQATPVTDPAPPEHIVEIPHPIPMPDQLKPLPEWSPPPAKLAPQVTVKEANQAARVEPTPSGFLNAMQVWPYSPAALYQVYTMPGKVTDIALEPGEDLIDVSAPDTVRWIIGDTRSGTGAEERRHVIVKPTRPDLQCNLAIFTSRRAYHLELKATTQTWMAAVSWEYPTEHLLTLRSANREREAAVPIAAGLALEQLEFRYTISGGKPAWRPLRAFDDHQRVYIQFPAGIAQGELPPLFVIGTEGRAELVNYRVHPPYYIVDRLFTAAELRLGGKHGELVRIARTDLPKKVSEPRSSDPSTGAGSP